MKTKVKLFLWRVFFSVFELVFNIVAIILIYGSIFLLAYLIALGLIKLGVEIDTAFDLGEGLALVVGFIVLFIRNRIKRNKIKNSETKETDSYKLN